MDSEKESEHRTKHLSYCENDLYLCIGDGARKRQRPKTKMNLMKLSTQTKCQWIKLTWNLVNMARTFNANKTYFMLWFVLFWLLWIGFKTRAITIVAPSRSIALPNENRIVLFSYIHKRQETNTSKAHYELQWAHNWTIYLSVGQWLHTTYFHFTCRLCPMPR